MSESVFVGGTVFFPEEFDGGGVYALECVLYPVNTEVCTLRAERIAHRTLCETLGPVRVELARSGICLPLLIACYPAFRPARLEFGAHEAAYALWKRFGGIPFDVLPAAASVR